MQSSCRDVVVYRTMKHVIRAFALLICISAAPVSAEQQPAGHCAIMAPHGIPAGPYLTTQLCRRGYLAAHDDALRVSRWVLERLSPASAWGCGERQASPLVDPDLPRDRRASPTDYRLSGYSMGHMANAANHLSDPATQRETAYASNMLPQIQELNAGLWFKLEVMVRVWAAQRDDIQVITGPVLPPGTATIGPNRIPVPVAFFKVVTDMRTGETLAFLVPHQRLGWREDPAQYVATLSTVEAVSGLSLPRPPGWAVRVEPILPWPVDVTLADNLREASCQR
jgi:endonuclease G, mitochondrial